MHQICRILTLTYIWRHCSFPKHNKLIVGTLSDFFGIVRHSHSRKRGRCRKVWLSNKVFRFVLTVPVFNWFDRYPSMDCVWLWVTIFRQPGLSRFIDLWETLLGNSVNSFPNAVHSIGVRAMCLEWNSMCANDKQSKLDTISASVNRKHFENSTRIDKTHGNCTNSPIHTPALWGAQIKTFKLLL